jgi:anti-sigma regulatory factor (Ser/Thr protein kinase)
VTWRDNLPPECDQPLGPPAPDAEELGYERDLAPLRRLVERCARRAGLGEERTIDLVLAANEIAANTISHTDGPGVIHVWHTEGEILCQVHDTGRITDPMAGRIRFGPDDRGHGLWLVNHVCDLVEIRSGEDGTTVRMHMRRAG